MLCVKNFRRCGNLHKDEEEDGKASEEVQLFFTRCEKEGVREPHLLEFKSLRQSTSYGIGIQ